MALIDGLTRAERRRAERLAEKEATYTLTRTQLEAIRLEVKKQYEDRENILRKEAAEYAFKLMLCIPVMALHEEKARIKSSRRKHGPEEIFVTKVAEIYTCFEKGLVTTEELEKLLYEETGIRFVDDDNGREIPKYDYRRAE